MAGVILPFAFGTFGLMFIFHVDLIPAVFAGASMTATSIGITASVFGELGYLKTREGQIVIGAAVLDDILGIVILAVVVALAAGGSLEIAPIIKLVAAAVVFLMRTNCVRRSVFTSTCVDLELGTSRPYTRPQLPLGQSRVP